MTFNALDLGEVRVYWLDGGGFRLDGGCLFGPVPRPRWSQQYPPAEDNSVALTAHVLLVETGSSRGLLDSGFGHHLTDAQRQHYRLERTTQLEQGLAELGLSTSSIEWVVLSHLHLDHAGGVLSRDARGRIAPVFPHAQIWVQSLETREARDKSNRQHGVYTGDALDHLEALNLIHEVDGAASVVPHVQVFLTGGHTRGHQATLVEGTDGAALLHLGDLLVTRAHLPPTWISAFDDFPLDTIRGKHEWLPRAAERGWWVTFSHDVSAAAALLDLNAKVRRSWPPPQAGLARPDPQGT